jgi:hypothetical protein
MKKYIFIGGIIIAGFILIKISNFKIDDFLKKGVNENEFFVMGQTTFYGPMPDEYLMLFDNEKLEQLKVLSTTTNYAEYPVSIFEYDEQYEIVIFKKNIDAFTTIAKGFLRVEQPLKRSSINTRKYSSVEGFINFRFTEEKQKKSLENVLITIPKEGKVIKEIVSDLEVVYLIDNCKEFNLFYREEKNPDLIFELSTQLFGRKPVRMGLALKQINNSVFFLFILPKNRNALLISSDLIKNLIL